MTYPVLIDVDEFIPVSSDNYLDYKNMLIERALLWLKNNLDTTIKIDK